MVNLTAVFQKVDDGWIAFVEEIPGANTQSDTQEEARGNLLEAIALVVQANRELAEKEIQGSEIVKENIAVNF